MKLLEPFELGPLHLPNRIVMAPMTRNRATGTLPNEMMATYYRQRVSAGLIITEATQVDPMGQGYPNTPGIHSEEQVAAWRKITEAVHEAGGRIYLQLWHVGRISHSSFHGGRLPVAPSAVAPSGQAFTADGRMVPFETPRALELDEIPEIITQFAHGARQARAAGFDGVEIHGANGYLLDQFLQTSANRRTDAYGGSVENRARLLLEVTDAVVDVWGPGRVGVRLSPAGGFNDMADDDPAATFGYVAEALSERPLAYLHGVEGQLPDGLPVSTLLRRHYDGVLVMAGGFDRDSGEEALQQGRADLIAYARLFLANPDLPERFARNAPLNEPDRNTFYGGGAEGYIDYPTLEEAKTAGVAA
ncbi:MAG: alkene reductase [Bacteroidetes bacterium]|nr:MAG: alkene reductase [Bacteroidota bacterium]